MADENHFSRRKLLRATALSLPIASGCSERGSRDSATASETAVPTTSHPTATSARSDSSEQTAQANDKWEIEPVEHDKLVGTHYYPWYQPPNYPVQNWGDHTAAEPVLGEYESADEAVINQHIKWAREHGINWLNISWSNDGFRHRILDEHVFEAELFSEIEFSILFESNSSGLLGNPVDLGDAKVREKLVEEFVYIEQNYFNKSNYLEIDGQPVVYVYDVNGFEGPIEKAFVEVRSALTSDPYLLASTPNIDPSRDGPIGQEPIHSDYMNEFDAVSPYALYNGEQLFRESEFAGDELTLDEFLDYTKAVVTNAQLAAEVANIDIVPPLMPGFDISYVSEETAPTMERSPEVFREMCREVTDLMDTDLEAVLVASFNEWPETTAIEPTTSWGETYLDIVEEEIARADPEYFDATEYDKLQLRFNKTVQPHQPKRHIALLVGALELVDDSGATIASYDIGDWENEPYLVQGIDRPSSDASREIDSWRMFGGSDAVTTIYFDSTAKRKSSVNLRGWPMVTNEINAEIYFNGEKTDAVSFGERWVPEWYSMNLVP